MDSTATVKKNVLVVDDEQAIHKIFQRSFDSRWVITSAYNGKEALDIIEKQKNKKKFSIIILDGEMPYLNGVDFLLQLVEKYPRYAKNIHIMLHSGSGDFYSYLKNHKLCSELRLYDFPKGKKSKQLLKIFSSPQS